MLNNRRGRFIVLGSSGECLPVTRSTGAQQDGQEDSLYSSCNSSDDEYHSANDSFDYGNFGHIISWSFQWLLREILFFPFLKD